MDNFAEGDFTLLSSPKNLGLGTEAGTLLACASWSTRTRRAFPELRTRHSPSLVACTIGSFPRLPPLPTLRMLMADVPTPKPKVRLGVLEVRSNLAFFQLVDAELENPVRYEEFICHWQKVFAKAGDTVGCNSQIATASRWKSAAVWCMALRDEMTPTRRVLKGISLKAPVPARTPRECRPLSTRRLLPPCTKEQLPPVPLARPLAGPPLQPLLQRRPLLPSLLLRLQQL